MPTELAQIEASLSRLAVFPLPSAVLLPSEVLPLHIFEPRYREMLEDVLAEGRALAIAQLAPGWEGEYEARPAIEPICGVGLIVRHERLADGRYNILLKGIARVRVEAELPPRKLYREVRATLLHDLPLPESGFEESAESVRRMLFALCAARPGPAANALAQLASRAVGASALADLVAAALLADAPRRRRALVTLDVGERLLIAQGAIAELLVSSGGQPAPGMRN